MTDDERASMLIAGCEFDMVEAKFISGGFQVSSRAAGGELKRLGIPTVVVSDGPATIKPTR
jgi:beta-glucosidase